MALPEGVALPKVQVARTHNQRLVVVARVEKASLTCLEVSDHGVGQFLSCYEVAGLERGLVESNRPSIR